MKQMKVLSISTNEWTEAGCRSSGFQDAMQKLIDVYGFEFPGISDIQHVLFNAFWRARYDQERISGKGISIGKWHFRKSGKEPDCNPMKSLET
jgi:hypothetical protein